MLRPVELEQVIRSVWVVVPGPPEHGEPLLELGVGLDHLVRWEVDQDTWPCARGGGGHATASRGGWRLQFSLLAGFTGWVGDEACHALLVDYAHTRHNLLLSNLPCRATHPIYFRA